MAVSPIAQEPNGTEAGAQSMQPPTSASSNRNSTDNPMNAPTTPSALSADEIALYDRQIRLWGAQAQERIRSANILLVSLRALGTEIAKNLTLAGVSSVTIIDDDVVTEEDLGTQYFLREEDIGKPRAQSAIPRIQELNPRVTVKSDGAFNDLLLKDQTYYEQFQCVIACDHDLLTLSMINTASRVANRPFYAAGIHGFYGYIFADLFGHEFFVEREKSNVDTKPGFETITRTILDVTTKKDTNGKTLEIVKKQEIYCPLILANSSPLPVDILSNRRKLKAVPALLPCLRALFDFQREIGRLPGHSNQDLGKFTALATEKSRELLLPPETLRAEFLRSFIQNIGAEIVPAAAFVGGRLSEDVINVLGQREQPIQNFALFDGEGLDGKIYCLYTPPPELAMAMGDMTMVGNGMDMGMGLDGSIATANGMGNGMDLGFMPVNMTMNGMSSMPLNMPMGLPMNNGNAAMLQNMQPAMNTNGAVPATSADSATTSTVGNRIEATDHAEKASANDDAPSSTES